MNRAFPKKKRSHFETTRGQSSLQTTVNNQRPFSAPQRARRFIDRQKSGIVYKINYTQCNFVYYDQTARSLNTRIAEHKKAVAGFDQNSKGCKPWPPFQSQHELWKRQGRRWFRSQLPRATFPRSLALCFGSERWERPYRTSRSLQRHRANMNYMVTCASFALCYLKSVW